MIWANIIAWFFALFTFVCAIFTTISWRRTLRSVRSMKALYAEEAPPVGTVEIHLITGEVVTVQPVNPHREYVWMVPIRCTPDEVDFIGLPDLPPHTRLVPVPAEIVDES